MTFYLYYTLLKRRVVQLASRDQMRVLDAKQLGLEESLVHSVVLVTACPVLDQLFIGNILARKGILLHDYGLFVETKTRLEIELAPCDEAIAAH